MAKVSPTLLKRPTRTIFCATFTSGDGLVSFPMNLRKLSAMELLAAMDVATNKTREYVSGYGDPGDKNYIPPMFLPPIDGQPVFLSETTCQVGAILWRAQTCEDEDRYTFEELVSFMVDEAILDQMSTVVADIKEVAAKTDNPLAVSVATSSPTPSTEAPPATPE